MQINDISNYFINHYHASIADGTQCERYLLDDQIILLALRFKGKHENYALLTEKDLNSFPPVQREKIISTKESPFDDLLLILYSDSQEEISCKIINGMGSRLLMDLRELLSD